MQNQTLGMTRRSLLTKAAIGLPAMGVVGALAWANPSSTPEAKALVLDGYWGPETTRALQNYFGTPVDGVVSGQDPYWRAGNTYLGVGWDWSGNGGSLLIAAIQRRLGVTADGYFGPATSRAWHSHIGLSPRDHFDNRPVVTNIQGRLRHNRF